MLDVGLGLGVGALAQQVGELEEVGGALLQRLPEGDLLAQALGLAQDALGGALVVPEAGFTRAGVEDR